MDGMTLQSGELGDLPLLDLFISARNAPFPTVLELSRGEQQRLFFFSEGALIAVHAETPGENLAAMLVRRKKIEAPIAGRLAQLAIDERTTTAELVMRERLLSASDLSREMSLWAVALLIQTFAWDRGSFTLRTTQSTPPDAVLEVRLAAAISRAVLKHSDVTLADSLLGPYLDLAPELDDNGIFTLDELDLDEAQRGFCEGLDGSQRVEELLQAPLSPPGTASRLLFLLLRAEMVSMHPPRAPVRAVAPQTAAPSMPAAPVRPAAPAPSAPLPAIAPVDMSSIRFHRGGRNEGTSGSFHAVTPHTKETMARASGPVQVQAAAAPAVSPEATGAEGENAARVSRLSALFGQDSSPALPRASVTPPRGPGAARGAAPKFQSPPGGPVATPSTASAIPTPPNDDGPPAGAGPGIEAEEWSLLPTKEKERIRILRSELDKLEKTNYFEWFDCTPDSQVATIKKSYFNAARRYHPDSLINESPVYGRLAEALFAKLSEAYDVITDDEKRPKYIKKAILGEKDENEIAMEKVQVIMAAEAAFKKGLLLLNAGKLGEALAQFKKAVEGYPEEGEFRAYYGYALFRVKEKTDSKAAREGIDLVQSGAEVRENNPKPWQLLGKAYLQLGDYDQAKANLRKALKIHPDNPEALRDYKRADALSRGETPPAPGRGDAPAPEPARGLLGGFLGRFGSGKDGKK